MIAIVAVIALPSLVGPVLAWSLRHVDTNRGPALGTVSLIGAGLLLLFTSVASLNVLRVFGERADLDLLLASPVPPSRILAAKSVGIYATISLPYLVITTPFVLASALFGHPGWLGATVMIVLLAVVATSLAQALARGLFAVLGLRLARTVYQVAGALLGATLFLSVQAVNFAPAYRRALEHAVAQPPSPPFDLPARAALGSVLPLLLMALLAVSLAWLATRWTAASLGNSEAPAAASRRRPAKVSFGAGPASTIVRKELRLLARDPELLSQVLLQLLYLLPVFALLVTSGSSGLSTSRVATGCTAIAALLASSLSWLIVCAEDAPDLLDAAPVARTTVARAKLAAACSPPLAVIAFAAAALAVQHPLAGALTLAASTGAALTTALLQARFGKPQARRAFRRRANSSVALTFGELALVGVWAATAGLLVSRPLWALVPLAMLGALLAALATGSSGVIALRQHHGNLPLFKH